jgi:hypothetical protein
MKKMILVGAFALLAACGGSKNDVSVGSTDDQPAAAADSVSPGDTTADVEATDDSVDVSEDTITVGDLSEMPPECIDLLGDFLKKIEPTVEKIDWDKATLSDFESLSEQMQADSDSFDAQSAAAGCDKYNLDTSDEKQLEQMQALAQAEAPGTVGYIKFLADLTAGANDDNAAIPTDCAGTIAAIEPFLASGGTMQDMTIADVTRLSQLIGGVSTNCSEEEASAFFARDDVTAFLGG